MDLVVHTTCLDRPGGPLYTKPPPDALVPAPLPELSSLMSGTHETGPAFLLGAFRINNARGERPPDLPPLTRPPQPQPLPTSPRSALLRNGPSGDAALLSGFCSGAILLRQAKLCSVLSETDRIVRSSSTSSSSSSASTPTCCVGRVTYVGADIGEGRTRQGVGPGPLVVVLPTLATSTASLGALETVSGPLGETQSSLPPLQVTGMDLLSWRES